MRGATENGQSVLWGHAEGTHNNDDESEKKRHPHGRVVLKTAQNSCVKNDRAERSLKLLYFLTSADLRNNIFEAVKPLIPHPNPRNT